MFWLPRVCLFCEMPVRPKRRTKGLSLTVPIAQDELEKWTERCQPRIFRPGHALFYRGHLPYGVFVLCWGTLLLTSSRRESTTGRRINAPALVGLRHVLKDRRYPFTAITTRESGLCFLPKSLLREWVEKNDPMLLEYVPGTDLRTVNALAKASGNQS